MKLRVAIGRPGRGWEVDQEIEVPDPPSDWREIFYYEMTAPRLPDGSGGGAGRITVRQHQKTNEVRADWAWSW
jgi:hypothetical protein